MLNDVKALCDASTVPGLISFCGAFHTPESGQVGNCSCVSALDSQSTKCAGTPIQVGPPAALQHLVPTPYCRSQLCSSTWMGGRCLMLWRR